MNEIRTGTLRTDIELIRPGKHGRYPMLFDPQADSYYKINEETMTVISHLDKNYTADEFLEHLAGAGLHITREDLLSIIAFLNQNNLTEPEYGQVSAKRNKLQETKEKTTFLRLSSAYLFFRLPPWRPEKFFAKLRPFVNFFLSKRILFPAAIPAIAGYLLIFRDFETVRVTFMDSLSWAGLAKYFAAILFIKLAHESAHALAATHFNCRIRGIGIGFMFFYPKFYTDTTDSWRLPRKQRLLIDAAGIIMELLLGGIAALLWVYLPPGTWKSTMFYIFAVSTISTLFVNGNPCIRYDGYYILCDLADMENLMSRSSEYIKQFWRHHFLKLGPPPDEERGGFLFLFGTAAFFYRIFLYTSIILIIYHSFIKALAAVLMVLELYSILIYPFYREVKTIRALSKRSADKAGWYLAGVVLAAAALLLFLPLSWDIPLPGEVIPSARRLAAVTEPGYLKSAFPRHPVMVQAGSTLAKLESPQLDFKKRRTEGELLYDRHLFNLQRIDGKTLSAAPVTWEKIQSEQAALEELERRRKELTVLSEIDGLFIPKLQNLSTGIYLNKGQVLGEVISGNFLIQAYATDREVSRLKPEQEVTIRLKDELRTFPGRIKAINTISARLKSSPLLQLFGGPLPVYIGEKNPETFHSVQSYYRIEIEFSPRLKIQPGRVVQVKVHHSERLFDSLRQLLLSALRREF